MVLYPLFQAGWFELMDCFDLSHRMEESKMEVLDCVEVVVEKETYARDGVHLGMQGWICFEQCTEDYWLVNFPQYGEKDDIAEISIREKDLKLIPVLDPKVNERIKAQYEESESSAKAFDVVTDDISGYMV